MSYPNQYPTPPQQGYGAPPPQGYPQQPAYGASPPGQPACGAPHQGPYGGAPPPGAPYNPQHPGPPSSGYNPSYGGAPPPQQQQQQYRAPQQQYGAPQQYGTPQQYGGGGYAPPVVALPRTYLGAFLHPSENSLLPSNEKVPSGQSVDGFDPTRDVEAIHKACKGFGTNEAMVTAVVAPLSAAAIPPLIHAYKARHGTDLLPLLEKELGGNYEYLILGIMRGPLGGDVHWLHEAISGAGTNETVLTELIIFRPPSSLHLLRADYLAHTHNHLDQAVESELSLKTKRAFAVALTGDWKDVPGGDLAAQGPHGGFGGGGFAGSPVDEGMVHGDVENLKKALRGIDDDELLVASIIFARSPAFLHRLQAAYLTTTHTPLTRKIKSSFTGHLKNALIFALEGGKKDATGCWRDAKLIHKSMEGMGTKDHLLIMRIVRAHWDRPRWKLVQQAYQAKYRVTLASRVMKETSGDYRDGLIALLNLP